MWARKRDGNAKMELKLREILYEASGGGGLGGTSAAIRPVIDFQRAIETSDYS
jgi:hypothetical protein